MKKAFTLAEVLVTLAIIGVVAALTIPALMYKYNQQALYTQFMKARADLNTALQLATAEYGYANDWFTKDLYSLQEGWEICHPIFTKYMSVARICKYNDKSCFASKYHNLNGDDYQQLDYILLNEYSFVLNNGMSIQTGLTNFGDGRTKNSCMFFVDTNGKKGPNVLGRDLFRFFINKDYNMIEPLSYRYHYNKGVWRITDGLEDKCKNQDGQFCGGYLLQRGKMDY